MSPWFSFVNVVLKYLNIAVSSENLLVYMILVYIYSGDEL
jgi:hypothetical protein